MNSNSELPAWMKATKGGSRTSAYSKPKATKKKGGNVSGGGMVKKGKRKAYLDSL